MDAGKLTRRAALAATAGATVALASCGKPSAPPVDAFDGLVGDFAAALLADSPELATRIGATSPTSAAPRLDDRSAQAVQFRREGALRWIVAFKGVDRARLAPEARVTYDVLTSALHLSNAGAGFGFGRFSFLTGFAPYVLNHLDSAFATLPDFFDSQHPIAKIADADAYVTRLDGVAAALDAETARARADAGQGVVAPAAVLDRTSLALAAQLAVAPESSVFVTSLRRRLEVLVGAIGATPTAKQAHAVELLIDAQRIVATKIAPAYRRAYDAVQELRSRAGGDLGVWRAPDGERYYAAALANATTRTLAPREVHEIGLQRVRELNAEADVALRALGSMQGSVGARLAALSADPRFRYPDTPEGRAQVIVDIKAAQARIDPRLAAWFGKRPSARLDYRALQDGAPDGQPAAFYQAPRPSQNMPGLVMVDVRDITSVVKFDLMTLAAHEGAPGHHYQMAMTQETPSLPLVRRLLSVPGFIEGWGVYAEQLVDEMGAYEGDPFGRLGYLRWRLWRAARLVVDTGIHALRWTREQAIGYLVETTGDSAATIAAEVDRYAVWPGQACAYELGALRITELREKARAAMGARFDIRGFHDLLLTGGALTLDTLADVIDAWIAGKPGVA